MSGLLVYAVIRIYQRLPGVEILPLKLSAVYIFCAFKFYNTFVLFAAKIATFIFKFQIFPKLFLKSFVFNT